MKAVLALETGKIFEGRGFGASGTTSGETVFCTALSGYQEVLTDPSYQKQIVVMTYVHIGNYGAQPQLDESKRPHVAGFVAREFSPLASHWNAQSDLDTYMKKHGVIGIQDIDTRALTRHLRELGVCQGVISTENIPAAELVARAQAAVKMTGLDLAKEVTCAAAYDWPAEVGVAPKRRVALLDYGLKYNIARCLARRGCAVRVFPASATAEDILAHRPDGIMLSNGPGDPAAVTYAVDTIRRLLAHNESAPSPIPIFGICLGHQLLGLALGGKTFKLKYGHRGANHPVKDLTTGKVEITTQNHGFCVDMDSLSGQDVEPTHVNLNDGTLEGLRHKRLPVFSVQHHPEAFPGPHDAQYLFDRFVDMMDRRPAAVAP